MSFRPALGDKGHHKRLYLRHQEPVSEINTCIRQECLSTAGNRISSHLLLLWILMWPVHYSVAYPYWLHSALISCVYTSCCPCRLYSCCVSCWPNLMPSWKLPSQLWLKGKKKRGGDLVTCICIHIKNKLILKPACYWIAKERGKLSRTIDISRYQLIYGLIMSN